MGIHKVVIGSDHGGFEMKALLTQALNERGIEVEDVGCYSNESVDYPHYAHVVADAVTAGRAERGVLICGTGIGMSMAANRHRGIRAAVCTDCYTAEMVRAHNDANVLCLGARVVGPGVALKILELFLEVDYEGGRHQRRIDAIELGAMR
jgi:ribose 5-phosphate isomerase B